MERKAGRKLAADERGLTRMENEEFDSVLSAFIGVHRRPIGIFVVLLAFISLAHAQTPGPLTWQQVRAKFEAANPTLRAGQINIDENKAAEITAFLRPNPGFGFSVDQLQPFTGSPFRPLTGAFPLITFNYLHERDHKRELRRDSAEAATAISVSQQADLVRTMIFSLRSAFISTLQAKAVLKLAKDNLDYFDKELAIARDRLAAGDISQLDMKRLDLQRVQYESDYQTALVNLRTAKIQLLQFLFERTPIERFDVTGAFEFGERMVPLEEVRNMATDARPDLKAAVQAVDKAKVDHRLAVSNGSTDPTFSLDSAHNPPFNAYIGLGRSDPAARLRSQSGRKVAHPTRHQPCRENERRGRGAGIQRCGLGIRHAGEFD